MFIVLFALSSVDSVKFDAMSNAFNQVFDGGTGVMDNPSPTWIGQCGLLRTGGMRMKDGARSTCKIQDKVNSYIEDKKLNNKLATSLTDEGLLVTIEIMYCLNQEC